VVASKCSWNHFISEKYKTVHHISHISMKVVCLCNYKLFAATVKVLEAFLEAIM